VPLIKLILLEIHFLVQFQFNNMKRLNKFLLFCCLVFIASCDPNGEPTGCTDETRETFVMPTILEEYFGMYQEGNWWVYYNEDSTKIDSLFVSDYEDEVVQAEFECEQSTWSNYHINSTYLAPNNTPLVVRHKGYNCCNWNISWMSESNTTGLRVTTNTSANNENTIIVPLPNHTEQIDSILLDNKIYYDVLSIIITIDEKKGYFVKGIGLVQFEINNEIFNLKRYNIR
jgi:hypothetical protein